MKPRFILTLLAIFGFFQIGNSQTARVQAIHNCPDPAAATVDVWLNNTPLLVGFNYKEASPFIDAPAGMSFDLSVCAPGSMDTSNAIFRKSFSLMSGETYTVVAGGGLAEMGMTAFDLRAYSGMEQAMNQGMNEVSVNVIHGAYDAPAVDLYEVQAPAGNLFNNLSFGQDLGGYINLPAADFDIQLRTASAAIAAEFDVNISTFGDGATTVLATGYLDPANAVGSEPFGLIAVFPDGTVAPLPANAVSTARVQAIHNCPDPAAATVDIYLDNALLLDDFNYKTASPFIDAPAGIDFDLSICAPNSMDTSGAIFRKTFMLAANGTYTVVASGGLAEMGMTGFDLRAYGGQEQATNQGAGEVSVNIIHGAYDAPAVDLYEVQVPAGNLFNGLAFGQDLGGYLDLPATDFDVQLRTASGAIAAEFDVNVTGLDNGAATVLATGYLDPANAVGSEPFGLIAVFPDGSVANFPANTVSTARVQAIHNCPDPAAATVDVYLDNALLLDDFNYKTASPYINAPAGIDFDLTICAPNSMDTVGAIFRKTFMLAENGTYTVVAGGGLAEMGMTGFDLRAYGGQEQATNQGNSEVSVNIIHGAYDAPVVDIYEVQVPAGMLADDLGFGDDLGGYADLPAANFDVQVRTQMGVVAAEFDVDISTLADGAATVLATGYLDPSSAVGSEPFGLIGVLPDGTVVTFPSKSVTPARLQVIHNCAATDAASVDVWLNDGLLIDDFAFRTASAFIDAPAGEYFDVSIALPTSMDTMGALFNQTFLLESGQTYIVVASGTVGSGTYTPATPFTLEVIAGARETSMTTGNVDAMVFHGATDAPTVDVVETLQGAGTIVDDISYGEYQGYLDLPATQYQLDIRDETGASTVATYGADISGLGDQAITILASGFLSPADDNDGEAFGLWVALPAGGDLLELSIVTSIAEEDFASNLVAYPNPVQDIFNIVIDAKADAKMRFNVLDMFGKTLLTDSQILTSGKNIVNLEVSSIPSGVYYVNVISGETSQSIKFIKN